MQSECAVDDIIKNLNTTVVLWNFPKILNLLSYFAKLEFEYSLIPATIMCTAMAPIHLLFDEVLLYYHDDEIAI